MVFAAADQKLTANAVPFPLRLPLFRRADIHGAVVKLVGQVERVGARGIRGGVVCFDERVIGDVVRGPFAHEFMGQNGLFLPGGLRQGAGHQLLADPDPETSGNELVEEEALGRIEPGPCIEDARLALRDIHLRQRLKLEYPVG